MSFEIKQRKNDGWFFEEKTNFPRDIFEQESIIFNKALLSLFSDGEKFKRFEAGNLEERKQIINECLNFELRCIRENLDHDLKHFVKIYPLIEKKKGVLN